MKNFLRNLKSKTTTTMAFTLFLSFLPFLVKATGLSGTYTINPLGSSSTNYTSFSAAASALTSNGVSGAVTFTVAAATFTETVSISSPISGVSATNTISFTGAGTGKTILTSTGSTISLYGCSNMSFTQMSINCTGSGYENPLTINWSNGCSFTYCNINNSASGYTVSAFADNICTFDHDTVSGGSIGFNVQGYSGTASQPNGSNVVSNSRATGFSDYGIYFVNSSSYGATGNQILNNLVDNVSSGGSANIGIISQGENGTTIAGNIVTAAVLNMLNVQNPNATSSSLPFLIYNNFIYETAGISTISFQSNTVCNLLMANNTFYSTVSNNYAFQIFENGATGFNFVSNVFYCASSSNAAALYYNTGSSSFPPSGTMIDGNDYYNGGSGGLVNISGTSYASLSSYKSAMSSYSYTSPYTSVSSTIDAAATNVAESYINLPSNIHLTSGSAYPTGLYAGLTTDIFGTTRSSTAPTTGAVEPTPIPATALKFDGADDVINVSPNTNIPIGNSPYTIEAWIKPTSAQNSNGGWFGIAGWGSYSGSNSVIAFRLNGTNSLDNYWWYNDLTVSTGSITLTDGNWHHVAATYDGTYRKVYCDGILEGTDQPGTNNVANANNLTIGKTCCSENAVGSMDEVKIWSRALSQSELLYSMNCELPVNGSGIATGQTGLALYYKLNSGFINKDNSSYAKATDASGNGNDGTLSNFALSGTSSNWVAGEVSGTCQDAATFVWKGSGSFNSSSNWTIIAGSDADGIPDANDTIIFNSTSAYNPTLTASQTVAKMWMQSSFAGTLTPAYPLITLTSLQIDGGNYTGTNLQAQGSVIINQSGLSGTILINGATDQTLKGTGTMTNLNISKTGGNVSLPSNINLGSNGTLTGSGLLKNTGGVVNVIGSYNFNYTGSIDDMIINAPGLYLTVNSNLSVNNTFTLTSVGVMYGLTKIKVGGNVTINSSWAPSGGSYETISLVGSTDQTLTGTGTISYLDISKTGGNVLLTSNINLGNNGTLTGSGLLKNTGGVVNVIGSYNFNYTGSIDDMIVNAPGLYLTVNSNLSVNNTFILTSVGVMYGLTKIQVGGNVTINSSWAPNGGSYETVSLVGSTDQTLTGTGTISYLDISKTGGNVLLTSNINLGNNGTLTGSRLLKNTGGIVDVIGSYNFNYTGSIDDMIVNAPGLYLTVNSNLSVNNTFTLTSVGVMYGLTKILVGGNVTINSSWAPNGGSYETVSLVGSTDQTLTGTGPISYLDVSKTSGNVLMPSNVNFGNNGTLTGSGLLKNTGGAVNIIGSYTFNYTGSIDDMIVNAPGLYLTVNSNLSINNTFTLTSIGVMSGLTKIKVNGKVTINSSWAQGGNSYETISLVGSTDQTLTGTGTMTYLDISKTGGNVLLPSNVNFGNNGTLTGSGLLKNTGGVVNVIGSYIFNYSGTIDDMVVGIGNTTAGTAVLSASLNINNTLTLNDVGAIYGNGSGHELILNGDLITTTGPFTQQGNCPISMQGSADQNISGGGYVAYLDVSKPTGNVLLQNDLNFRETDGHYTPSLTGTGGNIKTVNGKVIVSSTTVSCNIAGTIDDMIVGTGTSAPGSLVLSGDLNIINSLTLNDVGAIYGNGNGHKLILKGDLVTTTGPFTQQGNCPISMQSAVDQNISGGGFLAYLDVSKPSGNVLLQNDLYFRETDGHYSPSLTGTSGNVVNVNGKLIVTSTTLSCSITGTVDDLVLGTTGGGTGSLALYAGMTVSKSLTLNNVGSMYDQYNGYKLNLLGNLSTTTPAFTQQNLPISLDGTGDQNISGGGYLAWLDVTKSSGTVYLDNDVNFQETDGHYSPQLTGNGIIKNAGGRLVVPINNVVANYTGTVDDFVEGGANPGGIIVQYNDLVIAKTLTLTNAGGFSTYTTGKKVILQGDLYTTTGSYYSPIPVSMQGSGDQTISGTGSVVYLDISKTTGNVLFGTGFSKSFATVSVSAGTWNMLGDIVTATSAFNTTGGTIAGTGTLDGNVTCSNGGGGISPGGVNNIGCITINGNLSMSSGSTYTEDVANGTACTDYDQLNVNGTVTLSNPTLAVGNANSLISAITIINNDGTDNVSGVFSNAGNNANVTLGGTPYIVNYNTGNNDVIMGPQCIAAAIATQPSSITTCYGADAVFSVGATGTGLAYQWLVSTDNGSSFNNISGATASSYSTIAVGNLDNYQYKVNITGTCGNAQSTAAPLRVNSLTAALVNSQTICQGSSAVFSVTPTTTGTASLNYQWMVSVNNGSFTTLAGANASTYTVVVPGSFSNGNQYECIITPSACAALTSTAGTLTINPTPSFSSCPLNITASTSSVSCNTTVSYTASVIGTPTPAITYTFTGATTGTGSGTGSGSVFNKGVTTVTLNASNTCGSATACTFTITVNDNTPPVAIAKNITVDLDTTGNVTITAAQVNNGSSDNCGPVSMSVSPSTFNCGNLGSNNTVTLTVTDAAGNSSTATATVTVKDTIAPWGRGTSFGSSGTVPSAILSNVPEAKNFSVLYQVNIGVNQNYGTNAVTYAVDNSGKQSGKFNRIAYYYQLDGNWVWVSMDSLTTNLTKLGVPNDGHNPVAWQQKVTNMNVLSNVSGVTTGTGITTGNIEMWTGCYATGLGLSGIGGNAGTYDFNDQNTGGDCYGSFQVHNWGAGQTIFAWNAFDYGNNDDVGIGSQVGGSGNPDWTFAYNAGNYTTRTLYILVGSAGGVSTNNVTVNLDASGNGVITTAQIDNHNKDNCTIASESLDKTSFTCANLGTNTVTLTLKDEVGNTSSGTATVTVVDGIKPTAIAQNVTVNLDATGNATVTAAQVNNGSYDNCSIASMSLSKTSFNCTNLGNNNPVTLTVTDGSGNSSTATANVTVLDVTNPVAKTKNITAYLNSAGAATITASSVDNGSSDNCSIASESLDITSFSCENIGANTVTLTVTDGSGNHSSATATVTVMDTVKPIAKAKNISVYLDNTGSASITPSSVDNGSSDNCGTIASETLSQSTFGCSGNALYMPNNNSVEGYVSVPNVSHTQNFTYEAWVNFKNVLDWEGIITLQSDVSNWVQFTTDGSGHLRCDGSAGAISSGNKLVGDGTWHHVAMTCDGTTTKFYVDGNLDISASASGSFNTGTHYMHIGAERQPVRWLTGSMQEIRVWGVTRTQAQIQSTMNVQLKGNESGLLQYLPLNDGPGHTTCANKVSGTSNGSFINLNSNDWGPGVPEFNNPTITLSVTDAHGNVGTAQCQVTVLDTIKPKVRVKPLTLNLNASGTATITVTDIDNGSTDNCSIVSEVLSQTSFNCSNKGTNNVTLTVTDASGNVSSATTTVTIDDNTAPIAHIQNITVNLDATGNASITPAQIDNGSTDNCGITSRTLDKTTFNCTNVGANTVTLTLSDASGNTTSTTATVTVKDATSPTLISQNISIPLDATGNATITTANIDNGSYDNCGIISETLSNTSFNCSNIGANIVTLTIKDAAGNTSSGNATVTILSPATSISGNGNSIANGSATPSTSNGTDFGQTTTGTIVESYTIANNGTADLNVSSIAISGTDASNFAVSDITLPATIAASSTATFTVTFTALTINPKNATVTVNTNDCNNYAYSFAVKGELTCTQPAFSSCPLDMTVSASTSSCNATASYSPVVTGIPAPSVTYSFSGATTGSGSGTGSGSTFNKGTTMVTMIATNVCSSATCSFNITVNDNTAPVVVTKNATVYLDANGAASISTSDIENGSTDNCGIVSESLDKTSFGCLNTGTNTVTLSAIDAAGNTGTATAAVTVIDNIAPVARAKDTTLYLDANGKATIVATDLNSGSSDNCSIANYGVSNTSFGCNTATYAVALNGANPGGYVQMPSGIVNGLNDFTFEAWVNYTNNGYWTRIFDIGINTNVYMFFTPSADRSPNVGHPRFAISLNSIAGEQLVDDPNPMPSGWHHVALTIQKNSNNSYETGTMYIDGVVVAQNTAMTLSPASLGTCINNYLGKSQYGDPYLKASMDEVRIWSVARTQSQIQAFMNSALTGNEYGLFLYYNFEDGPGHTTVTDKSLSHNNGTLQQESASTAYVISPVVNSLGVGTHPVTLTVTDPSGNSSTATSNVTVKDTISPVLVTKNITVALNASGSASIVATDVLTSYNDNCGVATLTLDQGTFSCSNLGTNTVTVTATDVNGNTSKAKAIVTIIDNTKPTAKMQNLTVYLDANGNASVTAAAINNGSFDNCHVANISLNDSTFNCSNLGNNTVTLTATDESNNSSSVTAIVTVKDAIAPTVSTQNVSVYLDANGNATITTAMINNGSTDNCTIASYALDNTSFNCGNLGTNTVNLTVTDQSGNHASGSAIVTVLDNIAPTVITQNLTVNLDANGNASVTAAGVNNGSYDNCHIASISLNESTFNCSNLGNNTVILTAVDQSGNSSTGNATVTVLDNIAPTVVTQNLTVYLNASGNASVTATGVNNGSYDNCHIAKISLDDSTFNCSNLGNNNIVTLTAVDQSGNSSTGAATVTVLDNMAPTVVTQNLTVYLDANGNASVTASGINNGSFDNCHIASISLNDSTFNCSNLGNNTVILTAVDQSGNSSTGTSTVTVLDNIAPTIVTQNLTVYLNSNGNASVTAAGINNGSYDNCHITSISLNDSIFNCSNIGNNTVTLAAVDQSGNSSTGTATVTVLDNIAPTVLTQNLTVYLNSNSSTSVTAAGINNGSYDNCHIASISLNDSIFNCSNLGNNMVTLTAVDQSGNSSTGTATVTVLDNIAPTVVTQNLTVYLNTNGSASITAAGINNGSYDNCHIASISLNDSTFNCSNLGNNTVTLTAVDQSGNSAKGTAAVAVKDTTRPVVITKNILITLNSSNVATIGVNDINNGSRDNCSIVSYSLSQTSFNCSNVNANTVTLYATDESGNVGKATAIVTVKDPTPPVARAKNITVYLDSTGHVTITGKQIDNGSSDNCSVVTYTPSPSTFSCSNIGYNKVTLTVADAWGNTNSTTCYVQVLDNTAPKINLKNVTVYLNNYGRATLSATQTDNGTSDNCGYVLAFDHDGDEWTNPNEDDLYKNYSCDDVGNHKVTVYAIDKSNNASYASMTVTVADTTRPVVIAKNFNAYLGWNGTATVSTWQIDNGSYDNCGIVSESLSQSSFNCSNIGKNIVTLSAKDNSGNIGTATATVTVIDNIAPDADAKNITAYLGANGSVTITPAMVNNGSQDNCSIASMILSQTTFTCSNIGYNTVMLTVKDPSGNTSNAYASVYVLDTISPKVTVNNLTVYLDKNGNASVNLNNVVNSASDNCSVETAFDRQGHIRHCHIHCNNNSYGNYGYYGYGHGYCNENQGDDTLASFTCSNIGKNTVTVYAIDPSGNTTTANATITVLDTTSPVIRLKNVTANIGSNGTAVVSAGMVDNGSSDNCGIASETLSQSTFSCANIGNNNVIVTVKDPSGNTTTGTAIVTVKDVTAPTARAKNITVYLNASGSATVTTSQVDNGSSDNCSIASESLSKTSFTCANIGNNTVTLTVTDPSGNIATANATVTVTDNTAPVAKAQNATVYLNASGNATVYASQLDGGSTDNCGVVVAFDHDGDEWTNPNDDDLYINYGCSSIGSHIVTLYAIDKSNNYSAATATVTVLDTMKPVVKVRNITVNIGSGGNVVIGTSSVDNGSYDNCSIASETLSQTTFTCANVGINNVTVTVKDPSGNTSTAKAVVTVKDVTAPVARAKNLTVYLDGSGNVSITTAQVDNGSSDNCSIASETLSKTSFTCANIGNNNVTLTVTDPSGNSSTATVGVTVLDNIAPIAKAKNVTVYLNANGVATLSASQMDGGSTDNCGVVVAFDHDGDEWTNPNEDDLYINYSCSNIGTHSVTMYAIDKSNNYSAATATVTVLDTTRPVVKVNNITITLNSSGSASINLSSINNGSYDNCSIASTTMSQTSFNCSNAGQNKVTVTMKDPSGNVATATSIVTVKTSLTVDAGNKQVVYYGYTTAYNTATLSASASGGSGCSYSYKWTNGAKTQSTSVTPSATTMYYVTVTDGNGCTATDSVQVEVINVQCSQNGGSVLVCLNGNTYCEPSSSVPAYLKKGATLGACNENAPISENQADLYGMSLTAYPNPFTQNTTVSFTLSSDNHVSLDLYDLKGNKVNSIFSGMAQMNTIYTFDLQPAYLPAGVYMVRLTTSDDVKYIKIVKLEE